MKAFALYYSDKDGNFYELKEKVDAGAIFYEVKRIYKKGEKGFVRTGILDFFSYSDLSQLKQLKRK